MTRIEHMDQHHPLEQLAPGGRIGVIALATDFNTEQIEAQVDKPVMGSNQALAWHSLRLVDYRAPVHGFGALMKRSAAR